MMYVACAVTGSSPRVRGKLVGLPVEDEHGRIIPARAGQTSPTTTSRPPTTDHPRACGANCPAGKSRGAVYGSSPRVRGKPAHRYGRNAQRRIIPARAGQTCLWRRRRHLRPDHPRACGANGVMVRVKSAPIGSSPRVRGKRQFPVRVVDGGRIIPARAGQTLRRHPRRFRQTDHPRACGANGVDTPERAASAGSSPRVRGKRCGPR